LTQRRAYRSGLLAGRDRLRELAHEVLACLYRLAAQVWTYSRGNPLMVVEVVHGIREGQLGGDAGDLPFPDRVRKPIAGGSDG
jgi:hypothetical protein